ncbi:hypothetical protein BCR33DRAFT_50082 [Rhizoclosmatium globosum]|uniref:DUF654-domain-containing protein n=1 Tax=Rhizoclosmatium globosum TaxID=329046 RepID=A0A1Y2AVT6_9FUNG|nr:hypothetical protein BCR33DRAFT_50082 [Rhizoclosmatium globosum]|eukprot:ORY26410.1 hypothetical protein BCR33DRAFT_50082 [Rhizoclosmatium globosum]
MSSRAARKILKERELALAQAASNDVESSEDEQPVFVKKMNAFDMLMAGEDPQEQEEEEEEEEPEPKDIQPKPSPATSQKNKKKAAKKKQKKLKQQQLQQEEDEDDDDIQTPPQSKTDPNEPDEIDLALKEVNAKLGELPTVSAESTGPIQKKQRPLLAIDLKLLDADAEMRRLFGSKLIAQEALGRGRQNANQRRRVMMNPALNTKTHLVTPKEHWPRIPNKVGITMNMLQSPSLPSDAEKVPGYFDFTYTQGYQEIQMLFLQCVNSHDPGSINNLVHHYPFHVDALLQCSEIAKHNGDINIAAEYIERALFVFERAFHPLFNLATANCIVPYIYPENRALFLAVSRHISFVARKGCWRTCLELSKLLYSLDPEADPLGALQLMDWYAAKSGERAWIMRCWDEWGGDTGGIVGLPNWSFTVALCVFEDEAERKAENHNDSTERLRKLCYNIQPSHPCFFQNLLSQTQQSQTPNYFPFPQDTHAQNPKSRSTCSSNSTPNDATISGKNPQPSPGSGQQPQHLLKLYLSKTLKSSNLPQNATKCILMAFP